jgi:molybdopterin-synthase adenylyltransferase
MSLTDEENDRYAWQMWTPGFGSEGQLKLKQATVLISRIGGVGGTVAMLVAAAGVGRLILAHGGALRTNDLNRQLLMSSGRVGDPRVEQAAERLHQINPLIDIVPVAENISPSNVEALVESADLIISAAPLFEERLLMNQAAIQQAKPIIHCAMYDLEASVLVTLPGQSACLACLSAQPPAWWKREFPVFGAVASTAGSIGAMEALKLLAGLGEPTSGRLTTFDFRTGRTRQVQVARDPQCSVCGHI